MLLLVSPFIAIPMGWPFQLPIQEAVENVTLAVTFTAAIVKVEGYKPHE